MGSSSRRYVALLRGVNNIGMAKRVAMTDVRALFERLGYRDARTLLQSGNVVFAAPARERRLLAARIEKALVSRLGVRSSVTVLTGAEVVAVVRDNPLSGVATHPSRLLIMV